MRSMVLAALVVLAITATARADDPSADDRYRQAMERMRERQLERERSTTQPLPPAAQEQLSKMAKELQEARAKVAELSAENDKLRRENATLNDTVTQNKSPLEQIEKLKATVAELARKGNAESGALTAVPMQGDETSLATITADAKELAGKPLIVCGGVKVANYYNFNYINANTLFYSLHFTFTNAKGEGVGSIDLYAPRDLAKPLIEQITRTQDKGFSKVVRLRIKISEFDFDRDNGHFNDSAQLLDWQLMNSDRATWGKWHSEK